MDVVSDENGNTASVARWGSEEAARASLATLRRCRGCHNCSGCSRCSRCSDCSDCSYCSGCSGCSRCSYCSDCSYCSRCSGCSYCSGCAGCKAGYVHGTMGGYGWWVDPTSGRARVGCQERDDWEMLTRDAVARMAGDGAQWYDRYWAAWLSIIANAIGSNDGP